jgi:two-component system capsular synthesis response regulator RcsB
LPRWDHSQRSCESVNIYLQDGFTINKDERFPNRKYSGQADVMINGRDIMTCSIEVVEPISSVTPKVWNIETVLIMETCPMALTGIRRLLAQPYFQVTHYLEVPKAVDIPTIMMQHKVDLVIMELSGEGESILDGLNIINQYLANWPLAPLIVCTTLTDARLLKQLVAMGVNGIYLKQDPLSTLIECVRQVIDDKYSHSPQAATLVDRGFSHSPPPMLTYREIEVLRCLFTGKSVTATALALHRDIRTVSSHKRNAMSKLGFDNDSELYSWGTWLSQKGLSA